MKQFKHICLSNILLMGVMTLSACADILTEKPQNVYEKDDYFTKEVNAEMAVIGVYAGLTEDYNLWGQMTSITPAVYRMITARMPSSCTS